MKKENETVVATAPENETTNQMSESEMNTFLEKLDAKSLEKFIHLLQNQNSQNIAYLRWDTYDGFAKEMVDYLENPIEEWFEMNEDKRPQIEIDNSVIAEMITGEILKMFITQAEYDFDFSCLKWNWDSNIFQHEDFENYFEDLIDFEGMVEYLYESYIKMN